MNPRRRLPGRRSLSCGSSLLLASILGAHAQTNTNVVTLPEVNITARRSEAPPLRLPYLVHDITAELTP